VQDIVNMAAVAVVDAQERSQSMETPALGHPVTASAEPAYSEL
jgi:hypothetical protein